MRHVRNVRTYESTTPERALDLVLEGLLVAVVVGGGLPVECVVVRGLE